MNTRRIAGSTIVIIYLAGLSGCGGSSDGISSNTVSGTPETPISSNDDATNGLPTASGTDSETSPNSTNLDLRVDPGTAAGIDAESYDDILRTMVEAASVEALERDAARVAELGFELVGLANAKSGGESVVGDTPGDRRLTLMSEDQFEGGLQQSYRCDAGGSLTLMLYDYSGPGTPIEFDADKCVAGADTYDGTYRAEGAFETRTAAFHDFSARYADGGEFTIDGKRSWVQSLTDDTPTLSWTRTDYRMRDAGGEALELVDMTLTHNGPSELTDFDGFDSYTSLVADATALTAPFGLETALDEASLRKVGQSARLTDSQWQTGNLSITASDGSSMEIRAAAEDSSMVEIRLDDDEDVILQGWIDGTQVECPNSLESCS